MRASSNWQFSFVTLSLLAACGESAVPTARGPEPAAPTAVPPTSVAEAPRASAPYVPLPVRFENPGGMWMPHQMPAHAAKLKELGLAIDPKDLTDPLSPTLSAVVSLGGCSASFVSSEGLVITNHHCATGALQVNSSPEKDLLKLGFLAKTRAEEKSNGPTARVFVTQKVTDVSEKLLTQAVRGTNLQYYRHIEQKQKSLVAECEKDRPGIRCSVSSFYEGAAYYLIEQLELRDIRLVYAPAGSVGNYGGEIDNWRWPRHTGDVTMFRAYVGKDGKPADYSPENVPFRPAHHLKIATQPLREGNLVMVAGYPGRTSTLKTESEVKEAIGYSYPRRVKLFEEYIAALEALGKGNPDAEIKARPIVRSFGNGLTNSKGQLEGLTTGGLLAVRTDEEAKLKAAIEADPELRAKYKSSPVFENLAKLQKSNEATREADAQLRSELMLPKLVSAAVTLVRMAEERAKADPDRIPSFQERNWPRIRQSLVAMEKQYAKDLDVELLATALRRAEASKPGEAAKLVRQTLDAQKITEGKPGPRLQQLIYALYAGTKLDATQTRTDLFDKATTAELKKSQDPLIKLAIRLVPLVLAAEEREETYAGALMRLKPTYVKYLRAYKKTELAPDANGTLRITYGTVRGYSPKDGAPVYRPFTMLPEVVAKATDKDPFDAPKALLTAAKAKTFGPYKDSVLDEVPVDFLADLHITGGNSGSATLNEKGEITGLVFDGNYEAIASDWYFEHKRTRSIHVDIRYVLWLLDAVDGGANILKELGVTPVFAK
jgi:Peptidase S46